MLGTLISNISNHSIIAEHYSLTSSTSRSSQTTRWPFFDTSYICYIHSILQATSSGSFGDADIFNRNEKAAQRVSFRAGYPADVHADIPADVRGQKLRSGPQEILEKTSISVRTSMTRRRGRPWPQGGFKNFGQKNFGLNFRSLIFNRFADIGDRDLTTTFSKRLAIRMTSTSQSFAPYTSRQTSGAALTAATSPQWSQDTKVST